MLRPWAAIATDTVTAMVAVRAPNALAALVPLGAVGRLLVRVLRCRRATVAAHRQPMHICLESLLSGFDHQRSSVLVDRW